MIERVIEKIAERDAEGRVTKITETWSVPDPTTAEPPPLPPAPAETVLRQLVAALDRPEVLALRRPMVITLSAPVPAADAWAIAEALGRLRAKAQWTDVTITGPGPA